ARLQHGVPELPALVHRRVQLPAQFPDVGDARRQDRDRPEGDPPARGERESLVGDVVIGDALDHVTRARSPHAERAPLRADVVDLDRPVPWEVVDQPFLVHLPGVATRDHAEVISPDPQYREYGPDAVVLVYPGRVVAA